MKHIKTYKIFESLSFTKSDVEAFGVIQKILSEHNIKSEIKKKALYFTKDTKNYCVELSIYTNIDFKSSDSKITPKETTLYNYNLYQMQTIRNRSNQSFIQECTIYDLMEYLKLDGYYLDKIKECFVYLSDYVPVNVTTEHNDVYLKFNLNNINPSDLKEDLKSCIDKLTFELNSNVKVTYECYYKNPGDFGGYKTSRVRHDINDYDDLDIVLEDRIIRQSIIINID